MLRRIAARVQLEAHFIWMYIRGDWPPGFKSNTAMAIGLLALAMAGCQAQCGVCG